MGAITFLIWEVGKRCDLVGIESEIVLDRAMALAEDWKLLFLVGIVRGVKAWHLLVDNIVQIMAITNSCNANDLP